MNNRAVQLKLTPNEWWEEFAGDIEEYARDWNELFTCPWPKAKRSLWGVIKRSSKNVTRIPGDLVRTRVSHAASEKTEGVKAEISVEDRKLVLRDARAGLVTGDNLPVYEKLAVNITATEVNCRNVVRIKGMNLKQFYKVLTGMKCNIRPFFSEDKGENGGRWVMDNLFLPEILGETIDRQTDDYFLRRMWPQAPAFLPWSQWTNSRTHGVIYMIKNKAGQEELVVPVHIDAENAIVAIKEAITRKKRREIGAIEYHRMPEQQGEAYVGSGLSELGCLTLTGILRKAQEKGIIKEAIVTGEEKLSSSGSIAQDDDFMWKLYGLASNRALKWERV